MKSNHKVSIMDVVPSRRDGISTYTNEDGKVTLGIQRFKSGWINKYFMPKRISSEIKVPLDRYGSVVWTFINGKLTVSEIINQVEEIFPQEEHLDERIVTYLYHLKKDKLIDFLAVKG